MTYWLRHRKPFGQWRDVPYTDYATLQGARGALKIAEECADDDAYVIVSDDGPFGICEVGAEQQEGA
jgi:hypothetical protein